MTDQATCIVREPGTTRWHIPDAQLLALCGAQLGADVRFLPVLLEPADEICVACLNQHRRMLRGEAA